MIEQWAQNVAFFSFCHWFFNKEPNTCLMFLWPSSLGLSNQYIFQYLDFFFKNFFYCLLRYIFFSKLPFTVKLPNFFLKIGEGMVDWKLCLKFLFILFILAIELLVLHQDLDIVNHLHIWAKIFAIWFWTENVTVLVLGWVVQTSTFVVVASKKLHF